MAFPPPLQRVLYFVGCPLPPLAREPLLNPLLAEIACLPSPLHSLVHLRTSSRSIPPCKSHGTGPNPCEEAAAAAPPGASSSGDPALPAPAELSPLGEGPLRPDLHGERLGVREKALPNLAGCLS